MAVLWGMSKSEFAPYRGCVVFTTTQGAVDTFLEIPEKGYIRMEDIVGYMI